MYIRSIGADLKKQLAKGKSVLLLAANNWVIEYDGTLLPIEVKLTQKPSTKDCKHLKTFLAEYKNAKQALVICLSEFAHPLDSQIQAVPLQNLHTTLRAAFR